MNATIYHMGKHLEDNEIYPISEKCPMCHMKSTKKETAIIQRNPDITLLTCDKCRGSFASYFPSQKVLDSYYKKYYVNTEQAITFHNSVKFAKHILKPLDFSKYATVNILDFGGGDGKISRAIAKELFTIIPNIKINLTVVDYEKTEDIDEDNFSFRSKQNINDIRLNKYDLVIASAVLEHIPEFYETITTLFSLINKNGYFYARTPFIEPFMKLSKKVDMTYPGHLYDVGSSFWNRVVNTYDIKATIISSQPSIVETSFKQSFLRALIAYILKLPGYIECKLFPNKQDLYWNYIGGWEIYLKFNKEG